MREDNLNEETKSLISSLPSHKDFLGKQLYNYQGCWYYPNTLQGVLNFQKGFKPQETDIIFASFPNSSTTWLKSLTIALFERFNNTSSSLQSDNPHGLVPFLERLFSTHMPFHTLQAPFNDDSSRCKIVYVCRNVKDVLSSFESLCSGVGYFGPFWENVLSYGRGSLEDPQHVLFMRYEEMKSDPSAQVKRLAEFLGCPFTEERARVFGQDLGTLLDWKNFEKSKSL
ncbi:hypothetical protein F2Q70_00045118 [Brassica cretica]|uniref:Sulfotransferase n=1 Tax=Brassica cretica TaxID=69181 RepID=A0A8S9KH10_BRACR|nr:hypothetical protein F2Q70_00045118 [Brassica cretica]